MDMGQSIYARVEMASAPLQPSQTFLAAARVYPVASRLMSLEAVDQVRTALLFRSAARGMAERFLDHDLALDEPTRWIVRDLGRFVLYCIAIMLDAGAGASVAEIQQAATAANICSPGRVTAFVEYCAAKGLLDIPPGHLSWTQRPLRLREQFWSYAEERFLRAMEAVALLGTEPPLTVPADRIKDALRAATALNGLITATNPRLSQGRSRPMGAVIDHEAGASILYDWLLQQPADQPRLIERVLLNKSALARRHGVSRTHVAKLVASLEQAGLARLDPGDILVFSRALSEDLERHFAQGLQLTRASRLAVLEVLGTSSERTRGDQHLERFPIHRRALGAHVEGGATF